MYAALFLILNFGAVAVFYLMLQAPFISLAQVTVYGGAIMVLFLFVIMLLGAEQLPRGTVLTWQRPLAMLLGVVLMAEGMYVLFIRNPVSAAMPQAQAGFGEPVTLGQILFSQYLLPFEVTSVLLLVAMIGTIVLSRRKSKSSATPPQG